MKRIYSNYPNYEFEGIAEQAEKEGLSLAAFQRYCVMQYMASKTESGYSWAFPYSVRQKVPFLKVGEKFTVADLFPDEWDGFTNSQKMMLAKELVKYSKDNPHMCSIYQSAPGKTTVYIKPDVTFSITQRVMRRE